MDVGKSSTKIFLYKWNERREHAGFLVKRLIIKLMSICQSLVVSN